MSAYISDCNQYRYWLRRGSEENALMFVMLNPSIADATVDDPTIRRCQVFAEAHGYSGIVVANLYAYRTSNPKELWTVADPVGSLNDDYLKEQAQQHSDIICAWGTKAKADRVAKFGEIMSQLDARLLCLGTTKYGAPRHPLYVKGDQPLLPYAVPK